MLCAGSGLLGGMKVFTGGTLLEKRMRTIAEDDRYKWKINIDAESGFNELLRFSQLDKCIMAVEPCSGEMSPTSVRYYCPSGFFLLLCNLSAYVMTEVPSPLWEHLLCGD